MHVAVDKLSILICCASLLLIKCSGQGPTDGNDQSQSSTSLQSMVDNGWFPGQARLASFGRDNFNSVLVGDGWVLTAASVFRNNYNPYVWSAWVVAKDAFTPDKQTSLHVQNTFLYGGYKEGSNTNDIALVKLQWGQMSMPAQTKFAPVNFPVPGQLNENQTCYLIGWNNTENGVPSPQDLRTTPVTLMDSTQCNTMFKPDSATTTTAIGPGQLCLTSDNLVDGPCQGDQGSPVLCPYGNSWTVVGIVSDLFGCGASDSDGRETRMGTFTDVSYYLPWINKIMNRFSNNV